MMYDLFLSKWAKYNTFNVTMLAHHCMTRSNDIQYLVEVLKDLLQPMTATSSGNFEICCM